MKRTLSVLKADIGSISGHIQPSERLMDAVGAHVAEHGKDLLIDHYISFTGDDIAILATHERGCNDERIHKLAWDAFVAGTAVAKQQDLPDLRAAE